MKRFYLAAGALLLGSSAFAWAAGDSTGKEAAGPSAATATKSVDASKTGEAVSKAAWWSDLDAKLAAAGITEKASLTAKSIADKSAATTASDDPAVQAKLAS